jgi:hypothetical protein
MDTAKITVVYDGERFKDHTMDVRDLAPAMLSLGQLLDESNRLLNGNKCAVKLHVNTVSPGCFEIDFLINLSFYNQVKDFLSGDLVASAINMKELLFGGTVGLIWLTKWLKGKNPDKIESISDDTVRITKDDESYDVPLKLLKMYQDVAVRDALEKTFDPLKKEGVDSIEIKSNGEILDTVKRGDVYCFESPEIEEEEILDTTDKAAYTIISLAFKEDNKWRLFDGNSTISATIKDEDFNYRVENSVESFTKGDVLICEVRKRQYMSEKGLKTEYEVEKVIEHKKGARQIRMDFDDSES